MTAAIALPIVASPVAPTAPAAATNASGEGFAAALAELLGLGTATPDASAQPHTPGAKPQSATGKPVMQVDAVDGAAVIPSMLVAITPAPVAPSNILEAGSAQTSAQENKTNATLGVATGAAANAASAAAVAAIATDAEATVQTTPPPAAQVAAAAALNLAPASTVAPQTPDATLKPAKAAPAKHAPTSILPPRADATNAQTDGAKPAAGEPVAPIAQHASNDSTNGNTSQQFGGRPDTAAPQISASAAPVVMTVHTVSDTPAAAAPAAMPVAVPVDALAVHIARKFESGESRFEIRLDPIELGKLDISVTVTHDGRVQAVVRAERPETLDMLQRDARLLENQLRQSGLNVDSNSLNFSLGQGNGNRQAFGDNSSPFARALGFAPEIEATPTTTTIVSMRDGVDIRI